MKKNILSALVLAAVSAPSFATVKVDVYNESKMEGDRHSKQGVEVQYAMDMGLGFGIEVDTNKAVELSTNYVWAMDNGFYLKPQMSYVYKGEKEYKSPKFDIKDVDDNFDYGRLHYFDGASSDLIKAGLEAGYSLNNGFYTAIRYRVDTQLDKSDLSLHRAKSVGNKLSKFSKFDSVDTERSVIGRTDLIVGYNFDGLTLQIKGINRKQLNKKYNDYANNANDYQDITGISEGQYEGWSSEVKATITAFDGVAPYLQLASRETTRKGFDNNEVKLGVAFSF